MIIVYCENCKTYHSDDELLYLQPDIGAFCPECKSDELDFMSDREVLGALNAFERIINESR